jgi:hypothetical protein
VPDASFSVDDVLKLVGGKRMIDVVQVDSQKDMRMSLEDFVAYYKSTEKERKTLYNVLSLEFGCTPMEVRQAVSHRQTCWKSTSSFQDFVRGPAFVHELDWVELYWPDAQRQRYVKFDKKGYYNAFYTYPKVQQSVLLTSFLCEFTIFADTV